MTEERNLPPIPESRPPLPVDRPPTSEATKFSKIFDLKSNEARWRPYPIRAPYLIALLCLSLVLMVAIEVLRSISNRNHGLAFFQDTDEVPGILVFAYTYVPVIIAQLIVVLFSFTELNVLRLEPYFQLSKLTGAPATVLFIDYSFEHPFVVPFTSIQRKHWVVTLVSLLYLVASILLPALQNSLLALNQVTVSTNMSSSSWPELLSPANQGKRMSTEILSQVYNIIANGSSQPPFTTPEYAVSPIELDRSSSIRPSNLTLQADLQVYWANISCTEVAEIETQPSIDFDYILGLPYTNGIPGTLGFPLVWNYTDLGVLNSSNADRPCSVSYSFVDTISSDVYTFQSSDWVLVSSNASTWTWNKTETWFTEHPGGAYSPTGCNTSDFIATLITTQSNLAHPVVVFENTTHPLSQDDVLAAVKDSNVQYTSKLSSFACKPRYYTGKAQVTMLADGTVINVDLDQHTSSIDTLTDNILNISSIQDILSDSNAGSIRSVPSTSLPESGSIGPEIMSYFPIGNQERFWFSNVARLSAVNSSNITKNEYLNGITKAYKQAFALSTRNMFDTNRQNVPIQIVQTAQLLAITVTPFSAIFSEVLLALLALLSAILVYSYWGRRNCLKSDPDSIASICSLIADLISYQERSNVLAMTRTDFDKTSAARLIQTALNCTCRWRQDGASDKIDILNVKPTKKSSITHYHPRSKPTPKYLRFSWVALGVAILVALLIGMAAVLALALQHNGFVFLTDSKSTPSQMLWSFTPTIIATLIGSCWTAIYRDQSVLEPWVQLQQRGTHAKQSLLMNYASLPPIIAFFKSIKSRDFLISAITMACVANILLNILIGGLFAPISTNFSTSFSNITIDYDLDSLKNPYPSSPVGLYNGSFEVSDLELSFNLVRDHIANVTSLPPWTTQNYSFVPITISDNESPPGTLYSAVTAGISADLQCVPYNPIDNVTPDNRALVDNGTISTNKNGSLLSQATTLGLRGRQYYWNYTSVANRSLECYLNATDYKVDTGSFAQSIIFEIGQESLDVSRLTNFMQRSCPDTTLIITERWNTILQSAQQNSGFIALNCVPKIVWQNFTITFDRNGQVQDYKPATNVTAADSTPINTDEISSYYHTLFMKSKQSLDMRYDWPGLLTARWHQDKAPNTSLITTDMLYNSSRQVYSLIFSTYFSLNRDVFLQPSPESIPALDGVMFKDELRMAPSIPLFSICIFIMVLYVIILIGVFWRRRGRYTGPRIPNSIGCVIPWVIHSRMLKDFEGTHHLDSKAKAIYLTRLGKTYRFGEVVVKDNEVRLALEQEPSQPETT